MFERFTDRGRRVVVLAQDEARLLDHNYIGTEHILLGLIREGEGVAAGALEGLGISLAAVRTQVTEIIGHGDLAPSGHIPFTPRAKKVLELSLRESLQLGHNYIGTEHILLGLIREGEGVAAQVLVKLGADLSLVRQQVIHLLSGYVGSSAASSAVRGGPAHTPAAQNALTKALALAGGQAVTSEHYLLGLLADEESLAGRALTALGVTAASVQAELAELDVAGTSDELPEEAGARRLEVRVDGDRVTLVLDDAETAGSLAEALRHRSSGSGSSTTITGTDPEAEGFAELWLAIRRTLDGLIRDLGNPQAESLPKLVRRSIRQRIASGVMPLVSRRDEAGEPAAASGPWRPPGWRTGWTVAAYAVLSPSDGTEAVLETAPDVAVADARSWLAGWLDGQERLAAADDDSPQCSWLCILVDEATPGSGSAGWAVAQFGFGLHGGPPDLGRPGPWSQRPLADLVAYALNDLNPPPD